MKRGQNNLLRMKQHLLNLSNQKNIYQSNILITRQITMKSAQVSEGPQIKNKKRNTGVKICLDNSQISSTNDHMPLTRLNTKFSGNLSKTYEI